MIKRSNAIYSNFIIFLCLLLFTIITGLISEIIDFIRNDNKDLVNSLQIGIFGSIFSFFTYGIIVWPAILIINIILEIIGVKREISISDMKKVLIYETVIIGFISVVISLNYNYLNWLLIIPAFTIGQYFRFKYLK